MHNLRMPLLFSMILALLAGSVNFSHAECPKGFKPLFNGKDLTGWKGLVGNPKSRAKMPEEDMKKAQVKADEGMREHWKIVDGALEFDGKGKSLCTDKDYGDFEMYVDWKILKNGDSGLYLRGSPQIQMWDPTNEKMFKHGVQKGSGALWNNKKHERFPLVKADNPVGEWNTFYVRMVGERVTVKLNGKLVTNNVVMENYWERDKPIYRTGQIELQNHGNNLWFKNIYIREIPTEEANKILSQMETDGFESIFNGKDFTGWAGPLDQYEIKDGSVMCKKGKGGHIYTKKEYANFIVKTEFKLPPGGNNGLAIRYPGTGNAHKAGMTELQVLDSEHPKYAKLHPTQYHGSVYGLIPAHRGYLRKVGEWNYQQVTVNGMTIKVELNGFTILDADLSKVKKAKDGKVYPNIGRKKGHFGFAGHNDPVAFRNLSIKELPATP